MLELRLGRELGAEVRGGRPAGEGPRGGRRCTPAHREALQVILEDRFTDIVAAIAERSGLASEAVRALVDGGPFLGREALDAKLVDRLGHRDEVVARVKER